jgi:hypothetical protein
MIPTPHIGIAINSAFASVYPSSLRMVVANPSTEEAVMSQHMVKTLRDGCANREGFSS